MAQTRRIFRLLLVLVCFAPVAFLLVFFYARIEIVIGLCWLLGVPVLFGSLGLIGVGLMLRSLWDEAISYHYVRWHHQLLLVFGWVAALSALGLLVFGMTTYSSDIDSGVVYIAFVLLILPLIGTLALRRWAKIRIESASASELVV